MANEPDFARLRAIGSEIRRLRGASLWTRDAFERLLAEARVAAAGDSYLVEFIVTQAPETSGPEQGSEEPTALDANRIEAASGAAMNEPKDSEALPFGPHSDDDTAVVLEGSRNTFLTNRPELYPDADELEHTVENVMYVFGVSRYAAAAMLAQSRGELRECRHGIEPGEPWAMDILIEGQDDERLASDLGALFGVSFRPEFDEDQLYFEVPGRERRLALFANDLIDVPGVDVGRYAMRLLIDADREWMGRELFEKVRASGRYTAVLVFDRTQKVDECWEA